MDSEAISILYEIKTAIYVLLAVVIIGVIANWIRAGVSMRNLLRRELDDAFIDEVSDYYDKGNYEELISHCDDQLRRKPNHPHALWYKAKAYYQKREFRKSRELFEKLSMVEPSWDESHVQPYITKIKVLENESR
jgi:tetratricopeptide (TPR) repeat protein